MAQLFSQALTFLGVIAGASGAVGLGIALFRARVTLRRDPKAQAGGVALGALRLIVIYPLMAAVSGFLAWLVLVAAWIAVSNLYNAFVPVYPDCYPTLTNLTACSPSAAIQSDADQIIRVCAVLYGLYKGFDALSERPKTPTGPPASTPPPALPAPPSIASNASEGGSTS